MSKLVVRTSGDGEEESKIINKQSEKSEVSSIKSLNDEHIDSLGKKLLSNQLSSLSNQHLLLLDPSNASANISRPVEPKGRKIYLIPKLAPQSKQSTSISENRKKLKLVPIEPYRVKKII